MKKQRSGMKLWAVLCWIALWQILAMVLQSRYTNGHLLLASPLQVLLRWAELLRTGEYWKRVSVSSLRIFGGFSCSVILGVMLAVLAHFYRRVREFLVPPMTIIKAIPVASFIILALLWVKSGSLSFLIAFLICLPTIYLHTLQGMDQVDGSLLEMAEIFRVRKGEILKKIYLPAVFPQLMTALSVCLGLSWKSGVAAEIIGLPGFTIGERLYQAKIYFETPDLFAWTASVILLSVLMERLVLWGLRTLAGKGGLELE